MRKNLVALLRCPVTGDPLTLTVDEETEQEVRRGTLANASGTFSYPIVDGVVELLPVIDRETLTERTVRDQKQRDWAVERQRPYLNDNASAPWAWPAFAANVEQGLGTVDLTDRMVLDIGCATCWSTRMICEQGAQAVALDISTGILRDGEAQFGAGVYFDRIAATMMQIPFQDATFDVVFASAAVHHSSSLSQAFHEFARVLKPDGVMILVNEPVQGVLHAGEEFGQDEIEAGMNEHIYRLSDYERAAREAGFRPRVLFPSDLDKQLQGINPLPPSAPVRAMRTVWPLISPLRPLLLPLGHQLFGLTMVMVARKSG